MEKKDYRNMLILGLIGLSIMLLIKGENNIYGSETDWLSQHWALPEYFRSLFYATGNLFPNFAPNIGAGQNIYYFSYYGLLNPIILLSYLLPFISMTNYIIISSIIGVILSASLFYVWLRNNSFSMKISFVGAFILMLANPLIFHSHRHIMFINYIPFTILGLIGMNNYFKNNQKWLLIISIFLLIMTSYFYSVGGLVVLGIYAIYKIFNEKITLKEFTFSLFKVIVVMFVGIMMAGVLLLPTIAVILNSRGQAATDVKLLSLLIPKFNPDAILYTPYSMGLTAIGVVGLVYGFFSKDKKLILLSSFLSIIFFIPIFVYLLNGTLYVRYKVLIPFLPLVCLLITKFIDDVLKKEVKLLPILIITLLFGFINIKDKEIYVYFIDLLVLLATVYLFYKTKKDKIILIPVLVVALLNAVLYTSNENFVTVERYKNEFDEQQTKLINETIESDSSFYRFNNLNATLSTSNKIYHHNYYQTSLYSSTYNKGYNDFYYNIFKNAIPYRNRVITAQSSNILFQTLMGVKYIATSEQPPIGYELVRKQGNFGIYKNNNVFSLGYATDKIMNIDEYQQLNYPYNLEPLLIGVVTTQDSNYIYQSQIKEIKLDYDIKVGDNISIEKSDDVYKIDVLKNDNIIFDVNNLEKNQILIIEFELLHNPNCSKGDIRITINGIKNVLTCKQWIYHNRNYTFEYVVSANDTIEQLNVEFVPGLYEIGPIKTYTLDYEYIKELSNQIERLNVDMTKTKGDYIYGHIDVSKDGYFVTTIPYDKGFKVTLNGEQVDVEKVNEGFLGFPIKKGSYDIVVKYEAPLFKEGVLVSGIGSISFMIIIILDYKKKK